MNVAPAPAHRPATPVVHLGPGCRVVDLLSDVHLRPDAPRTFQAWRAHMLRSPADAIFILGDLFELWIGDDAASGPFERACLDVLQQSAHTRRIAFLAGNRDFLLGPALQQAVPMEVLPDPVVVAGLGTRLLLAHGDAWCLEDGPYQVFRREVRSHAWQHAFLSRPLEERATIAGGMREVSQARKRSLPDPQLWADLDPGAVAAALENSGTRALVHGHTHRPARHDLGSGLERWVLCDWDFDTPQPRADVLRWSAAGLARHRVPAP